MKHVVSNLLEFMLKTECFYGQEISSANNAGEKECQSTRVLKLCFLGYLVHPYLKQKINISKLIRLSLVASRFISESLFEGNIKKLGAKERAYVLDRAKQADALLDRKTETLSEVLSEVLEQKSLESRLIMFLGRWINLWEEIASKKNWEHKTAFREKPYESLSSVKKLEEPFVEEAFSYLNKKIYEVLSAEGVELAAPKIKHTPFTENLLDFMTHIDDLCQTQRDNLMADGRRETDADHIIKLMWWIMVALPHLQKKYDEDKLFELALVHDIVEARCGDIPLSLQHSDAGIKLQKIQNEWEAIMYFRAILPPPLNNLTYNLFEEYETKETPESKVVWALDKLDANWQANLYNGGDVTYWGKYPNGEVYYQLALTRKPLVTEMGEPLLKELEDETIKISQKNMESCGIKVGNL